VTAQELLRVRAHHLKAISELRRHPPGHEFAYQRLQTQSNSEAIDRHQAAIAEIDAELERRRK
jgi:hypothetical protein